MVTPAKRYAMKILMANVHVEDKKLFKEGLEDIFYPTSPEDSVIIDRIQGDVPENLNTLEKIANAINNDENFYTTIQQAIEKSITEEEFVEMLNKNLPAMSEDDILNAIK